MYGRSQMCLGWAVIFTIHSPSRRLVWTPGDFDRDKCFAFHLANDALQRVHNSSVALECNRIH